MKKETEIEKKQDLFDEFIVWNDYSCVSNMCQEWQVLFL